MIDDDLHVLDRYHDLILCELDDLDSPRIIYLDNIGPCLQIYLRRNGLPQSAIWVYDGTSPPPRPYAVAIYNVSFDARDAVVPAMIWALGKFSKLCIVGSADRINSDSILEWNFTNPSNYSVFLQSQVEVTAASIAPYLKGISVVVGVDMEGPIAKTTDDLNMLKGSSLLLVNDWHLLSALLQLIYLGTVVVDQIIVNDSQIKSWIHSEMGYDFYGSSDHLIHDWIPLLDRLAQLTKVYHLVTEVQYDKWRQLPETESLAGTLMKFRYGQTTISKLNMDRLRLMGCLQPDHILWQVLDLLKFEDGLITDNWISLCAALDYAYTFSQEVVDQLALFLSLINYCDNHRLKPSTLIYEMEDKYKAAESDILSLLNYLPESGLYGRLKSTAKMFGRLKKPQFKDTPVDRAILDCFIHGFFYNVGRLSRVSLKESQLTRFRLLSVPEDHSVPELHLEFDSRLSDYYTTGNYYCWYQLQQPRSLDDFYPFLGCRIRGHDLVDRYHYQIPGENSTA